MSAGGYVVPAVKHLSITGEGVEVQFAGEEMPRSFRTIEQMAATLTEQQMTAVRDWRSGTFLPPLPFGDVSPAQAHGIPPLTETYGDQIEHWFTYHTPSPREVKVMQEIREKAKELAHCIRHHCPPSADRSAAIRLLRESVMTANASIVLGGK